MSRSEVCRVCHPDGGAVFDVVQPRADYVADMPFDPQRFVKRCRNYFTEKPWRRRHPQTES